MGSQRRGGKRGKRTANNSSNSPAQQNKPSNPIAAPAQSAFKAPEPETKPNFEQPENRYERRIANWTVVVGAFTIILAIATAGSGVVLWLTDHTLRDTLIASNRAWIAPINMKLREPLAVGKKPYITLTYANTGKEPALNFGGEGMSGTISGVADFSEKAIWGDKKLDHRSLCNKVQRREGDQVVYPVTNNTYSLHTESALVINDNILRGKDIIVVQACLGYSTMGADKFSAVCMYLAPDLSKPSDQWEFRFCPTGNSAS